MHPIEWLTLIALVVGPVLAVGIQLWFERRREIRRRKLSVLDTLMSYRGRFVHSDNVRAMNLIDVIFYRNKRVRARFSTLIAYLETDAMAADQPTPDAISRADDLIAELLTEMAKDVGYAFDHTVIKRQAYRPRAFQVEEKYTADVRAALMPVLRGENDLHVKVSVATDAK